MRILFTGGGTGGHTFPIIAVVQEIKKIARAERILELEFLYMGPDDVHAKALHDHEVRIIPIVTGKMRRYFSLLNFIDVWKVPLGVLQVMGKLFFMMPDVIFSKGGYGALPVVIAAACYRIPLVIHESDAVPGLVNRFASRFASRIGISFDAAAEFFPEDRTALVGVPIRKDILGTNRAEARASLNIHSSDPVVSFIGASQGAQKINEVVLDVLPDMVKEFEVVHQTGEKNFDGVVKESGFVLEGDAKQRYHPFGFLSDRRIAEFYAASDVVVSRAGASSIYEIAAWGKPAILVPLENSAQDHQLKNAFEYASDGAALVMEQANLKPHLLLSEIKKILGNPELMKHMSAAAQKFSKIEAAELIAREIIKLGFH